jgi:hypothetical protein
LGPVIKDALKALEQNNPDLVMKWIDAQHENAIINLFNKTLKDRFGDQEIYNLLEKHFLETLVSIHREGEGEPYTGLKPAGTTKQLVKLTDIALKEQNFERFLLKYNAHIN